MKTLTTVPIKLIKEYVIKGWNASSHLTLKFLPENRKAAHGILLSAAYNEIKKEKKYKIEPSFLSYHSNELLDVVEKLLNAGPRTNT